MEADQHPARKLIKIVVTINITEEPVSIHGHWQYDTLIKALSERFDFNRNLVGRKSDIKHSSTVRLWRSLFHKNDHLKPF